MLIRIVWLQIVEFDIFYHLEQSLWIFIFFHPFLFTCGRLPFYLIVPPVQHFPVKFSSVIYKGSNKSPVLVLVKTGS